MLLRLLPAPSAKQLSPPTILFTLPLATAPYTSKNLPLPPFLWTHRNACAKEGIECNNALLGDKASWIPGIVDEVTFSVKERKINVVLIDGTAMVLPIERECRWVLDSVISEVQLSFAAQQAPPSPSARMSPVAGPSISRSSSTSSNSSSSSGLRSPSALLSALLSPIMNNVSSSVRPSPPPPNPSRVHRRQARSLLVDAFRQYVLPVLKESWPSTFMLWSLQGELAAKRQEWEEIKAEVDAILVRTGASHIAPVNAFASSSSYGQVATNQQGFKSSSSLDSYDSAATSDSESTPPTTPATSVWNHDVSRSIPVTPLAHLSTLPACSALPFAQRTEYANYVSRLASLASRLSSIQKLLAMIHKEQGRRSWLESLEASRQVDKAMRRSWSNRAALKGCSGHEHISRPVRSSPLWESHVDNQVDQDEDAQHPAMIMDVDESEEDEEECMSDDDVFSPSIVVRPISPIDVSNLFTDVPALVPSSPAGTEDDIDPLPALCARRRSSATSTGSISSSDPTSMDRLKNRRPSIETMDLSNYRIISTASIDSDEHAGSPSSLLGHIESTQVHEIPPKDGEAGFRVGVAIVR